MLMFCLVGDLGVGFSINISYLIDCIKSVNILYQIDFINWVSVLDNGQTTDWLSILAILPQGPSLGPL